MPEPTADWCEINEDQTFAICGTRMKESSRRFEEVKWCFSCRKRREFFWVVRIPDGLSYYGPDAHMECGSCSGWETDLFPGWTREYVG